MPGDNLRCQRCDHPYAVHHPVCHHTILGGWDDKRRTFSTKTGCTCQAYVGIHPKDLRECPHELLTGNPVCVHCLKTVPVRKK